MDSACVHKLWKTVERESLCTPMCTTTKKNAKVSNDQDTFKKITSFHTVREPEKNSAEF